MAGDKKVKVCITGGAGFIGSHLGARLMKEGYHVVAVDWVKNEFMENHEFCHEFKLLDLRDFDNAVEACRGCEHVYNLAADMGGMGFICSAQATLFFNNTMISSNMCEAARRNGAKRLFYASSACVYNEDLQLDPKNPGLTEDMAWPAHPQDAYGLEKLYAEEMVKVFAEDFGIEGRILRFHNIYGPRGTWKGGREKSPAAFCRKAYCSTVDFEMWGDGKQTRSYTYVDDCVEGIYRIMMSDCKIPLNLGTEEMVSMNDFAKMCLEIGNKPQIPIRHVDGPMGVRGRNSENTLIRQHLGWEPSIKLRDGIARTYKWIGEQVEADRAKGIDVSLYATSKVVVQTEESLGSHGGNKKSLLSNPLFMAVAAAAAAAAGFFFFNKKP